MVIVSQDKKEIVNFNNVTSLEVREKDIWAKSDGYMNLLGEYATEERAKEVLIEMRDHLMNRQNLEKDQSWEAAVAYSLMIQGKIFEMPRN